MQKSMSLQYEPSSEPLHLSAKQLSSTRELRLGDCVVRRCIASISERSSVIGRLRGIECGGLAGEGVELVWGGSKMDRVLEAGV